MVFGDTLELSVKNLEFSYGNKKVLSNINFVIGRSGVYCILGPNGAGKSSLLKCLAGILKPQKGDIKINGQPLAHFKRRELSKIFAYLPQTKSVTFPYSVAEMVVMGRAPYIGFFGKPTERDYEIVEKTLEILGCTHLIHRTFDSLSGGEKQLVYIARALVQQAKVLLFDEPTSALDFKNRLLVMSHIKSITKANNLIAIVALHDPNEVFWFGDEVILLSGGKVVGIGPPEYVLNPETVRQVYGVDVKVIETNGKRSVIPWDFSTR